MVNDDYMAKGKYRRWIEEDGLTLLEGWARDGLTNEQIAYNCDCNTATLYEWMKKFPEIDNALKKGKEVVDFEVENALYQSAISGNTTAQIFWLKNRKPDKWRDNPKDFEKMQLQTNKLEQLINGLQEDESIQ